MCWLPVPVEGIPAGYLGDSTEPGAPIMELLQQTSGDQLSGTQGLSGGQVFGHFLP